ncbi:MAG: hypothetical protein ABIM36_03470 [candidate division WOR-3 bacterium]
MEIFGIGLTLLAGVLTYLAWSNGKWMKEMLNRQNEILNKHTEILEKISEMLYKMDETLRVMEKNAEERHREVIELIKHLR